MQVKQNYVLATKKELKSLTLMSAHALTHQPLDTDMLGGSWSSTPSDSHTYLQHCGWDTVTDLKKNAKP